MKQIIQAVAITRRKSVRSSLLLAAVLLMTMTSVFAQTTWTGSESSDWNNEANWSAGVPESDNAAIIPDVTNDPVIQNGTTAFAKSILVQTGGILTITATGSLTVNGQATYEVPFTFSTGLNNLGTVINNGQLILGSAGSVGTYGIVNQGTFNNNSTAEIRIDNALNTGLYNAAGTFTNAAELVIGASESTGLHGIWNDATFSNNAGGHIHIDRSSLRALVNHADEFKSTHATFNNAAAITIGAVASIGTVGIRNVATFNNNAGGDIKIDQGSDIGLYNSSGTFTNQAVIIIGATSTTGIHALTNEGIFDNNTGGSIQIDRSTGSALYHPTGIFNNASSIVIGSAASAGTTGIESQSEFNNNTGGSIKIDRTTDVGLYHISGTFTNKANITIGANQSVGVYGLRNTGTFNNTTGTININRASNAGLFQTNRDAPSPNAAFTNTGNIVIGAVGAASSAGIENQAIFSNNTGGHIYIDNTSDIALKNPYGTFNNEADITIGASTSVGTYGLVNRASFNNNSGGHIRIDRSTDTGLYHAAGTFTNAAAITIGKDNNIGINGIFNESVFNNNAGGDIRIDRSTSSALRNFQNIFTNAGSITTGAVYYAGDHGIRNQATFENNIGGEIKIEWSHDGIYNQMGTFNNAGTVSIGSANGVMLLLTRSGVGKFNNNANGILKGIGTITPSALVLVGGTLSPGFSPGKLTFSDSQNFSNSNMDIEVNGTAAAGVNFDQIAVTGTATLGGTLTVSVNYTPTNLDEVTIVSATLISGSFSDVNLPPRWKIVYSSNAVKLVYDTALPVRLVAFTAKKVDTGVHLQWRTASEINNKGFLVERSPNGLNWNQIGFVDGNGTISQTQHYVWEDRNPIAGINYYRLRQIDLDGKTEYSRIIPVRFEDAAGSITVWADAARQAHIQTEDTIEQVTVFDLSGRVLLLSKAAILNLSQFSNGILLVRVQTNNGIVTRKLLLL
ncbi:T9SS type A sorting domain-containing protein [Dyadobacter sp. CY312]|uniref:T9SS type A sorting domain-containing protein n=1 Tax=Dyadobacter sp. CY312 TaxID=2907303 RepID=UPI001F40D78E|nr:T9SS type A sorting domain-containing protein [Dyadobacter sp. CY312]MCE7044646.1 T9SS type A sorting domain-containing protein [Dyadobacter sp. CY312]